MSPNNQSTNTGAGQQPAAKHPLDNYTVQPQQNDSATGGDQNPYYQSSAPTISLPKGGGALKGIDEKFSVNVINGTAGVQVSLPFSPGRSGFTPALGLSYNSGSGNSEFGLGWSLSLPDIRRRTDKRLPEYKDAADSDTFLLAGAEDLVPQLNEDGDPVEALININVNGVRTTCLVKRYMPRTEGLFARIEYIRSLQGAAWWRVTTGDNITTYYGLTAAGRISDPEQQDRIFRWLPQLVFDHKGNVQEYQYKAENFDGVDNAVYERNRLNNQQPCTNRYLKRVRYCNLQPQFIGEGDDATFYPSFPEEITYLMEAVLDYGDHHSTHPTPYDDQPAENGKPLQWAVRRDPFSDFHAGFEIRTWRLCRRILMFHRFEELMAENGLPETLVRSLDLTYLYGGDLQAGGLVEADLISAITQTGYTWGGTDYLPHSLPAMRMDYQPLQWNNEWKNVSQEDTLNAPQGLTGPCQWIDLWGEGLPGLLTEQGQSWQYKTNLGNGHFTPAQEVASRPSLTGLASGALQWQDLDADGRRQVVSRQPGLEGYFELNDDQQWESFKAFRETAHVDWSSPYTKMLDLDGDGRPDVLLAHDTIWTWYANKGTDGMTEGGQTGMNTDEEKGPRLVLNDTVQSIFLADMNGDGMTDIVRIKNGEVCYWPNLGWGKFGAKVTMKDAPVFDTPELFNPLYLQLTDISGTGAADLVYLGAGTFKAWINLAGNGFSEAYELATLPGMEPYSKIALLDFIGNGTGCLVWSAPLPQYEHAPMRYIDLMGGIKPYLMTAYHNGMGKTVAVTYKSSTQFYLADKIAGTPWATRLPFPVQCIDRITTTDAVSETSYTQSYTYHHGYYDHEEREFRGFGRVDTLDTEHFIASEHTVLDQPPVLTKTWYHTGAWMREGTLLDAFKTEYYHFDGWDALPVQANFPDHLSAQEIREAHRALKGSALRQEVYALDDSPLRDIPYTATISTYRVRLVQPRYNNRYASFLVYGEQNLAYSCERQPEDTRLAHSLTLEVDAFGHVLKSAQIAYPRQSAFLPADEHGHDMQPLRDEQSKTLITCAITQYTNSIRPEIDHPGDKRPWRMCQPWQASAYQLHLPENSTHEGLWTIDELLHELRDPGSATDYSTSPSGQALRLLSSQYTLFRGDDVVSVLPTGQLASLAIPHEQFALAFTQTTLEALYDTQVTGDMLEEGKYRALTHFSPFHDPENTCYWLPSGEAVYDTQPEQKFYTPSSFKDPWGHATTVKYWGDYWLLPASVTDAQANPTTVNRYNWLHLQPERMTDMNNNISEIGYDALGMPIATALMGKGNEGDYLQQLSATDPIDPLSQDDLDAQAAFWTDADPYPAARILLGKATWRCIYDLNSTPVKVAMIARQQHWADNQVNANLVVRVTYTDGLGRIAMHKATAADDPANGALRWNASGKTVYNNKGKAVLQYEPYYSPDHSYDPAAQAAAITVSPKLFYDPMGRVFRTEMPDGTYSMTTWNNWEQKVYDAGDTVYSSQLPVGSTQSGYSQWYLDRVHGQLGDEERDAAAKSLRYADTPAVIYLDTLARPVLTRQHNRTPDSNGDWQDEYIYSREMTNIEGSRLVVIDGRGLTSLHYRYNLLQAPCYQYSMDGGEQLSLAAADGQPLYHWDAQGQQFHFDYDTLRRAIRYTTPKPGGGDKVLQIWNYSSDPSFAIYNWRGRLVNTLDSAGLEQYFYNFRGDVITAGRYPTSNVDIQPDWSPGGDHYDNNWRQTINYLDAFGQPFLQQILRYSPYAGLSCYYGTDRSGTICNVYTGGRAQDGTSYFNARGQIVKTVYNNNTFIAHTYDPVTFRLRRSVTTRTTDSKVLQDLHYWYDAAGNISLKRDEAIDVVFFNNCMILPENDYTYDTLYRLIRATGREQIAGNVPVNWNDNGRTGITGPDCNALRNYIQTYTYDATGNMLRMRHIAGTGSILSGWTRNFVIDANSNRLLGSWMGSAAPPVWDEAYSYDTRGNMTGGMSHLQAMQYNELNRLETVTLNSSGDTACYQYGNDGQRFKKAISRATGVYEYRYYVGMMEEYRRMVGGVVDVERFTAKLQAPGVNILVDYRTIGAGNGEPEALARYQYSDHLGSSSLELDEDGQIITFEEYYPFGSTSFQSGRSAAEVSLKRYRYTGKERDEETGLNYHGARYYAPWLCRWCAVDPLEGKYTPWSSYNYGFDNPITYNDPTGMGPGDEKVDNSKSALGYSVTGGSGAKGNNFEMAEHEFSAKATTRSKIVSFAKGVVKGFAIAGLAIFIIGVTGGAGLVGLATAMTYAATAIGTAAVIKSGIEIATGKDLISGERIGTLQKWKMGGELVGGIEAGSRLLTGAPKIKNVDLPSSLSEKPPTAPPTFAEPTHTAPPKFSEPTSTDPVEFSKSQVTTDKLPSDKIAKYRDLKEIGFKRNLGYAEGEVNGMPIDNNVVGSGQPDKIPELFDALPVNSKQEIGGEGAWLRTTDSEYKILNRFANKMGAKKGEIYPEVKGEITLVSEREYCPSCQAVIRQFQQMYPNIKMNFVNGTKY